jgi:hypothetical protein
MVDLECFFVKTKKKYIFVSVKTDANHLSLSDLFSDLLKRETA